MKKTYKLIGIAFLALILITIIKERPKEDLTATADLDEEFSKITFDTKITPKVENKVVDFSVCDKEDSFEIETVAGKNSLEIIGVEGSFCIVETNYENSAGAYTNECKIPLETGQVTFNSVNFEVISQYCSVKIQNDN